MPEPSRSSGSTPPPSRAAAARPARRSSLSRASRSRQCPRGYRTADDSARCGIRGSPTRLAWPPADAAPELGTCQPLSPASRARGLALPPPLPAHVQDHVVAEAGQLVVGPAALRAGRRTPQIPGSCGAGRRRTPERGPAPPRAATCPAPAGRSSVQRQRVRRPGASSTEAWKASSSGRLRTSPTKTAPPGAHRPHRPLEHPQQVVDAREVLHHRVEDHECRKSPARCRSKSSAGRCAQLHLAAAPPAAPRAGAARAASADAEKSVPR